MESMNDDAPTKGSILISFTAKSVLLVIVVATSTSPVNLIELLTNLRSGKLRMKSIIENSPKPSAPVEPGLSFSAVTI